MESKQAELRKTSKITVAEMLVISEIRMLPTTRAIPEVEFKFGQTNKTLAKRRSKI